MRVKSAHKVLCLRPNKKRLLRLLVSDGHPSLDLAEAQNVSLQCINTALDKRDEALASPFDVAVVANPW